MADFKSIFITGAGSGIGRAVALRFAREGWFVGLGDVNREGMEETASQLPDGASSIHLLDVRDSQQWESALSRLEDLTTDEIERTLDVNLNGVIYGARAAYPYLKAAAPGSCLVNTCSAAGIYGQGGMTIYCASKMGVRAITESLDIEWAADAIRVTDIMPGYIDTPLLAQSSHAKSNKPIRQSVQSAGLEFTPVETVADTFWDAVHGRKLHNPVGKTAKTLARAARWFPSYIRNKSRKMLKHGTRFMG
jgi:NAD(P)-dependent dehydrogenase (short-subunit alcohol dehydrogenase family)